MQVFIQVFKLQTLETFVSQTTLFVYLCIYCVYIVCTHNKYTNGGVKYWNPCFVQGSLLQMPQGLRFTIM